MSKRLLYFEPVGGAAGDMICAALLDLGVPIEVMRKALGRLELPDITIDVEKATRHAIAAQRFVVSCDEHQHARSYADIKKLLAKLVEPTRSIANRAFAALANAEAKVHGVDINEVHFHEVGAIDSIADIVCAAAGLASLDCDVFVAPLPLGRGTVQTAHGTLPLPAPATLECLIGFETYDSGYEGECVTPTAAALFAAAAQTTKARPAMRPLSVGWGAGSRDPKERPNVLRATLADPSAVSSDDALRTRKLSLLETNLDDTTPEVTATAIEALFAAGVRDAWQTPIVMKKGRAAVKLSALVERGAETRYAKLIMRATGTLGVRVSRIDRFERERRTELIDTEYGPIHVKIADRDGLPVFVKAELDDCARAAKKHGVTVGKVREATEVAYSLKATRQG